MRLVVAFLFITFFIQSSFSFQYEPTIVGKWYLEKDESIIWEFTKSGEFKDSNEDEGGERNQSTYKILDRSNSCNAHSTDPADMKYLSIDYGNRLKKCFYLETVSKEFLVLMDTDSGRLLIFKRKE